MATINKEIEVCDVCGEDTNGFYYYESTTNPFGAISESKLIPVR